MACPGGTGWRPTSTASAPRCPSSPRWPVPDLVLVNDDDLTYAKIRLDKHSLGTLVGGGISEFTDSLPAALCLAAAWEMCRDAEMAARDYVRLVMSAVDSIEDITVTQVMLRQAATAARRFADPAWSPVGLERIADALRDLLQRAEPGSDLQLAYAQAFTGVLTSADDLAVLAGLLSGSAAIDGLDVDTEFRWLPLRRLVSRGAAGPAEIDAELARDPTDAGALHAAASRAAIPDPAAKQDAWRQVTSGSLPNATFRATLNGFDAADTDEALLDPYLHRYFEVVGRPGGTGAGHGPVFRRERLPVLEDRAGDDRRHGLLHRPRRPAARAAPAAGRGP